MTAIAALMHSIARQKMSDEDELLLSAAASAATIALTACIVKRRRKRVERFGCDSTKRCHWLQHFCLMNIFQHVGKPAIIAAYCMQKSHAIIADETTA